MFHYLLKRLGLALITLFVILFVSYFLMRMAPGTPEKTSILSENPEGQALSSDKNERAQNTALQEKLHLNEPIIVGFGYWLKNILLHGDLGSSASVDKGRPVTELIMERLPVTLTLNIWSILIIYMIAIPLGIYSAMSIDSKLDKAVTFFLYFLYSLPVMWVALVLQAFLCEGGKFPIFPAKGIPGGDIFGKSTWEIMFDNGLHYVLPVFCLCYGGMTLLSRYARTGMLEVIRKDYIRTARAKGLPEYVTVFKHALRNALIILITLFAGLLPGLIAGSIIIEYVFSIPGMGSLSMTALNSRDYPLLMALFAFGGILTLLGIMLSDVLYVLVDPRISFEDKR